MAWNNLQHFVCTFKFVRVCVSYSQILYYASLVLAWSPQGNLFQTDNTPEAVGIFLSFSPAPSKRTLNAYKMNYIQIPLEYESVWKQIYRTGIFLCCCCFYYLLRRLELWTVNFSLGAANDFLVCSKILMDAQAALINKR